MAGEWSVDEFIRSLTAIRQIYLISAINASNFPIKEVHGEPLGPRLSRWTATYTWEIANRSPMIEADDLRLEVVSAIIQGDHTALTSLDYPHVAAAVESLFHDNTLQLKRVQYASPGFTDIAGLGVIIGHIKDFVLRILEMRADGPKRELELQVQQAELQRVRIENARALLNVVRESGSLINTKETSEVLRWIDNRQGFLLDMVNKGKITGAELLDESTNS